MLPPFTFSATVNTEVREVDLLSPRHCQTSLAISSAKILNVVSIFSSCLDSSPPSFNPFTLSGPAESWCPVVLLLLCSVFSSLFWILFWSHSLALEASTRLRTTKVQKRFMESWTRGRRKQELPFTLAVRSL